MTMKDWMGNGYRIMTEGVEAVRIMGRRPTRVSDDLSPGGEFGWQRGDQWLDDTAVASSTLPRPIFRHLPQCPNAGARRLQQEGNEVMPRWPTEAEALSALDWAAWTWAVALCPDREHIGQLVAIWRKETEHLSGASARAGHPTTRPIVALGDAALPYLRELAQRQSELYWLIQEIEDR